MNPQQKELLSEWLVAVRVDGLAHQQQKSIIHD
jgi:hypothetical protein